MIFDKSAGMRACIAVILLAVSSVIQSAQPDQPGIKDQRSVQAANSIRLYNETQFVSDLDEAWPYTTLMYTRTTSHGEVLAQINHADRMGNSGIQGQLSAYPRISDKEYLYLGYAYSDSSLFPEHYLAGEWYTSRIKDFEFSLGGEYYKYKRTHMNVWTASAARYLGDWVFSYRPKYFHPDQGPSAWLHRFTARKYYSQPDTYVSVSASLGEAPDLADTESIGFFVLDTRSLFVDSQFALQKDLFLKLGIGYTTEEFPSGLDRNKASILFGLIKRY